MRTGMKIVYRILIFLFVFCGSVVFFSRDMSEQKVVAEKTVTMENSNFPLIFMSIGGNIVNTMYGYSMNLDANSLRDSITLMTEDKALEVQIDEKESSVRKLAYELRSIDDDVLLDSDSMLALETDEQTGWRVARLKMQADLTSGREYALKLMLVTKDSRKIYYYTRIKYYESDVFFEEKLDFAMNIHNLAWNKDKNNELQSYLETDGSMDNTSLAMVTIHSSHSLICWGDLKPKLVGDIVPVLKEINIETAVFELSYRVTAKTASGKESFIVKEFFRVRYANNNKYLLYYQRSMEADFNIKLTSLSKNELKIGITEDSNMDFITNENGSRVAFVRNRELWYYNIAENKAVLVFSFKDGNSYDERELYDQHDIRIIAMNDDVVDFIVYGYMNRGSYEGKTAVILYRFYPEQERVEERVYIPFEMPFERMKYDLDEFSYVSSNDVFYFSINGVVYAYNIPAKRLEVLAEGIRSENIYLCTEGGFIAWQNSSNPRKAVKIMVLNLETEKRKAIKVKKGRCLTLLGGLQGKLIYGIMKRSDITEASDGTIVTPIYEVRIAGPKGKTVKTYKSGNYYVTGVKIVDSIITLYRAEKHIEGGKLYYSSYSPDHIINNQEEKRIYVNMTSRATDLTLTEYYVNLTQGYVLEKLPSVTEAEFTVLQEDTTLRLNAAQGKGAEKYYVYALGDVVEADTQAADAVNTANTLMGVVIDSNGRIIWERGAKYNHNTIEGIHIVKKESGVSSKGACLSMLLSVAGVEVSAKELSDDSKSMYSLLKKHSQKMPLKLTGCSLDAVLYYVSAGRPVIAMKNAVDAVLLTGYDEYLVTVIDPLYGRSMNYSMEKAEKMFGSADNVFISYT